MELNDLLRGEISAVETYRQAMEKVSHAEMKAVLRTIESDHEDAVTRLQQAVVSDGGSPDQKSGPWGTWAKTVTGAAKLLSESAVLKVLKEGEEHGLKEYEEALGDEDDIDAFSREIIRDTLVPRQRAHIAAIDRCIRTLH